MAGVSAATDTGQDGPVVRRLLHGDVNQALEAIAEIDSGESYVEIGPNRIVTITVDQP